MAGSVRRLSKDYEFLPATSAAVIQLAMIQLLVRRLASKDLLRRPVELVHNVKCGAG